MLSAYNFLAKSEVLPCFSDAEEMLTMEELRPQACPGEAPLMSCWDLNGVLPPSFTPISFELSILGKLY